MRGLQERRRGDGRHAFRDGGCEAAVYKELPGWKGRLVAHDGREPVPQAFKDYIRFLETELETSDYDLSVGPDRAADHRT